MKQHLMILNNTVFCKEYLRSCNSCLQFKFKKCLEENVPFYSNILCDDFFWDFNDDDDDEVNRTEQIFNFVDVPSFVLLISGSPNEPLYFAKVT